VVFEEHSELSFEQRLVLWRVTDVLLCSSVREGLNLLPFE